MTEQNNDDDRRSSERRWVMMRVLIDDRQSVEFGHTINISETGVLIERVPELQLQPGQQLRVVMEGLLDNPEETDGRAMTVVRVNEDSVALTFND